MEEDNTIDIFYQLISHLKDVDKKNLINALKAILERGGCFTITYVNQKLGERGIEEIDEEILEAFLEFLVKEFKYSVETKTLH